MATDNQQLNSNMTPKQAAFVMEYMIDRNATQAAIRAGYSPKTANEQGCRLLTNVSIQAALSAKTEAYAEKVGLTVELVIAGLMREANGEAEDTTASSRVAAWVHLGKHLKMFTDKVDMSAELAVRSLSDAELIAKRDLLLARIGVVKAPAALA